MKKQMTTRTANLRTAILKFAFAALFVTATGAALNAQTTPSTPGARVQYIGTADDKLVFEIQYANIAGESFSVEIKDAQGYQFYFDRSKDKSFRKRFAIARTELGDNAISFVVTGKAGVQQQTFDVNASFRVVEEVSVVKL